MTCNCPPAAATVPVSGGDHASSAAWQPRQCTLLGLLAHKACHAQVQLIAKALQPLALRRLRADTGAHSGKQREIWVPLKAAPAQQAAYCSVLVRSTDVLTDPKPPRHAGHRAAQIRAVCAALRKVRPAMAACCKLHMPLHQHQ